jgi:hypothetical protein
MLLIVEIERPCQKEPSRILPTSTTNSRLEKIHERVRGVLAPCGIVESTGGLA